MDWHTTILPNGATVAVLTVKGRMDMRIATPLRQELYKVIESGQVRVIVDMSQVTFLDSSGLGVLVSALNKCRIGQGMLCLAGLTEPEILVLEQTGMDQVIPHFETLAAAIANFPSTTLKP